MCKEYELNLDSNLTSCYEEFRADTSKIFSYAESNYPVVYLSITEFAKVTIKYYRESKMTLIVNLQDYYVFGFIINDKCYAFKGVDKNLREAGFKVDEVIPYGDAYYEIGKGGIEEKVCNETVTFKDIVSSIDYIIDMNHSWEDKKEYLLRVFWTLVEGVRFNGISDVVQGLINGKPLSVTYRYFFFMAERWEKISVGNAYLGDLDKSIAVYDLRPLEK